VVHSETYTVSQKGGHFYFYDNFGKSGPNFIFFTVKFRKDLREMLEFHISSNLLLLSLSLSLSLLFNGHFPGEPGLAGVY